MKKIFMIAAITATSLTLANNFKYNFNNLFVSQKNNSKYDYMQRYTFIGNSGEATLYIDENKEIATLELNGKTYSMLQVPSASGTKYETTDKQVSIHTKISDGYAVIEKNGKKDNFVLLMSSDHKSAMNSMRTYISKNGKHKAELIVENDLAKLKIDEKTYDVKLVKSADGEKYSTYNNKVSIHAKDDYAVISIDDKTENYNLIMSTSSSLMSSNNFAGREVKINEGMKYINNQKDKVITISTDDDGKRAVANIDGVKIDLFEVPSADGAKYMSDNGKISIHTKADEALLNFDGIKEIFNLMKKNRKKVFPQKKQFQTFFSKKDGSVLMFYYDSKKNTATITLNSKNYTLDLVPSESGLIYQSVKDGIILYPKNDEIKLNFKGEITNYTYNKNSVNYIKKYISYNGRSLLTLNIYNNGENAKLNVDGKKYDLIIFPSQFGTIYMSEDGNIRLDASYSEASLFMNGETTFYSIIK